MRTFEVRTGLFEMSSREEKIAELQERRSEYRTAERHLLAGGQSYTINQQGNQRTFAHAHLGEIRKGIAEIDAQLRVLRRKRRGPKIRYARPVDER